MPPLLMSSSSLTYLVACPSHRSVPAPGRRAVAFASGGGRVLGSRGRLGFGAAGTLRGLSGRPPGGGLAVLARPRMVVRHNIRTT